MGKAINIIVSMLLLVTLVSAVNYIYLYNPYTAKRDRTISLNQSDDNITVDYFFGNLSWTYLYNYPVACPSGAAITQLGDSSICTTFAEYEFGSNNFNGSGNFTTTGNLNVTGKIHNSLSHMYGLSTITHIVASGGVWYNITMNRSVSDVTQDTLIFHSDNQTLELGHDGHYSITFGMGIKDSAASPDAHVGMRISLNGEELRGSYIETDTTKKDADQWLEHTTHFEGIAGDNLTLQYISDDTTVIIEQDDTYAIRGFSAFGSLQELIV